MVFWFSVLQKFGKSVKAITKLWNCLILQNLEGLPIILRQQEFEQ